MEYQRDRILEIYSEEISKTEAARIYAEKYGLEYTDSLRKMVSNIINKAQEGESSETKEKPNKSTKSKTSKSEEIEDEEDEVFVMPSAWEASLNRFLSIEEYCTKYNLDLESLDKYNLVAHNSGHMIYNVRFKPTLKEVSGIDEAFIESVIKKYSTPLESKIIPYEISYNRWFDRLVYTDTHLGMDVNGKSGTPLYAGKWDREEVLFRRDAMISHVKTFKRGSYLIIDDLGDFLDGLGGQTTRKGHDLPQNMSDAEVFDLGIEFKTSLIDALVNDYDLITCNIITDDNHSGVFAYFVAKSFKDLIEERYPNKVKVNIFKKFIEHYAVGKHTFVDMHGKDGSEQKFGFKPFLDSKQIEKLDQYCKENRLYNGNFIEVAKGDTHIALFDESTSNDFDYYNYPSFSPPSNWVKTNFKNSKSGFRFFNIDKESQIKIHIPFYFDKQ